MRSYRLYAWLPRSSVVQIQAIVDAYEGLARVRTERHDLATDRSLLLFLVAEDRKETLVELLKELANEMKLEVGWLDLPERQFI